jgi:tetratricopeptide (TPR) repeat protein
MNNKVNGEAITLFQQARNELFIGNWEIAARLLKKLERLGEKNQPIAPAWTRAAAHRNLGLIQFQMGGFSSGIEHLEKALSLGASKDASLCHALGSCYHLMEKHSEAVPMLREAIKLNGQDALARFFLGLSCIKLSDGNGDCVYRSEAEEQCRMLLGSVPNLGAELRERLGRHAGQ